MKQTLIILLLLSSVICFSQRLPFGKHFTEGTITFKDSSKQTGLIKYPLSRSEKIKFKENAKSSVKRYSPKQLLNFKVDTFNFVSLSNFKVISNNYPLFAKKSKIKSLFARQLVDGKINTFLMYVHAYNANTKRIDTYPNIVFEKTDSGRLKFASYPYKVRMGKRKYEKAKKELFTFFADYPMVVNRIKTYNKHEDFMEVVNMVHQIDLQ